VNIPGTLVDTLSRTNARRQSMAVQAYIPNLGDLFVICGMELDVAEESPGASDFRGGITGSLASWARGLSPITAPKMHGRETVGERACDGA
jgi:hypothetical protein